MPTIVDFPTIVKQALGVFCDVFESKPVRCKFAEYLIGMMVVKRQIISGTSRELTVAANLSGLNRWLPETMWDVDALNNRRLEWLQRALQPRYSPRGVIAIDNTLGIRPAIPVGSGSKMSAGSWTMPVSTM